MPDGHEVATAELPDPKTERPKIEPWLTALLQSEHLALLLGNGLPRGVAFACGAAPAGMDSVPFPEQFGKTINAAAELSARRTARGRPNFEDQIRTAVALATGYEIEGREEEAQALHAALDQAFASLVGDVLTAEREVKKAFRIIDAEQEQDGKIAPGQEEASQPGVQIPFEPLDLLGPFLMSFASRSTSRERLNIFTTNYDRFVEFGAERVGLRILDRFIGTLSPIFRSSRLDVDLHYNPPGIRGEPRFLEGVVRLTKLHGSIDWQFDGTRVRRAPLPFGAPDDHPDVPQPHGKALVVYPNASKDVETSEHPYSELFRDFSAAICRPNSVLVTYGYGFGDSHINAALADMLTMPSTHLLIISFDEADGRIEAFMRKAGHSAQISYLIGNHFGDLNTLVEHYLPKPAIDTVTRRRTRLMMDRHPPPGARNMGEDDAAD